MRNLLRRLMARSPEPQIPSATSSLNPILACADGNTPSRESLSSSDLSPASESVTVENHSQPNGEIAPRSTLDIEQGGDLLQLINDMPIVDGPTLKDNEMFISASRYLSDDANLFELMFQDSLSGDPIYRPGPFWQYYEARYAEWFKNNSLHDLSRNAPRGELVGGFTTTDQAPEFFGWGGSRVFSNLYRDSRFGEFKKALDLLLTKAPDDPFLPYNLSISSLRRAAWRLAKYYGLARGAKSIEEMDWPAVGRQQDAFIIEGKTYTYSSIYYYIKYAFASRHVRFDDIDRVIELGAGSGRQAVVTLSLHPHLSYAIFDIPTSLYFSHQYLKSIYGDRVVDYRHCRKMNNLRDLKPGHIYLFGSWQFPMLRGERIPLFWNCQSFQEMSSAAVKNYTDIIGPTVERAFLTHTVGGTGGTPTGQIIEEAMPVADDYSNLYLGRLSVVERAPSHEVLGDDLGAGGIDDLFLIRQ